MLFLGGRLYGNIDAEPEVWDRATGECLPRDTDPSQLPHWLAPPDVGPFGESSAACDAEHKSLGEPPSGLVLETQDSPGKAPRLVKRSTSHLGMSETPCVSRHKPLWEAVRALCSQAQVSSESGVQVATMNRGSAGLNPGKHREGQLP